MLSSLASAGRPDRSAAARSVDGGTFSIFRDNAITLTNAISGGGVLRQFGTGVTSINTANTYTGGTMLSAGTLAIGNGARVGNRRGDARAAANCSRPRTKP